MDLRKKLFGARYKDKVILTVGNLVARKGHDMVIRALPSLRKRVPDVSYLSVGEGPYRSQLETLAVGLGVQDRVIFAGRASADDLPHLYALCDVFVMPSREQQTAKDVEGFGIVFIEASACAKPVIGGRSGGISGAIVDRETGLLADPHDPKDISNVLSQILTDRNLGQQLGQQGRTRVAKNFTWSRIGERLQGILDHILREESIRN